MAAGDLAVTLVGTYATLALLVAAWDAGNDALVTDYHVPVVIPGGAGGVTFALIKVARTA